MAFTITASQLANLLQILGALVADYIDNPTKPMQPALAALVKSKAPWSELPGLTNAIKVSLNGGDKVTSLFNLGTEIKGALPIFRNNRDYSTPEIQMLKAIRAYLATDSDTALTYIKKHASVFGSPKLAQIFTPPVPKADNKGLQSLVQSLVGRPGKFLTVDEMRLVKETDPKQYDKYVELRKAHNQSFKASLAAYVRATGQLLVDYRAAYDDMVKQGFTHSMVPGFTGKVDDQGRWYTTKGELVGGVPNLTTYSRVVMNPNVTPEAAWIFKAVKPDSTYAYFYTAAFRRSQSDAKYQAVAGLMTKIPSIRKKWLTKLYQFDIGDKMSVCAVILEILYTFAARIGSEPGRGAGTLLVKNMTVTQQGVNLAYIGKDSIPTKHIIKATASKESKALVAALLQLPEGKTPSSMLYTIERDGRYFKVTPADVNKAFRLFGAPADLSVHKLRTCRGTTLFKQLVDNDNKMRPPTTEKDALKRYRIMTEKVGKLLNHKRGVGLVTEKVTGVTAASSYIDAGLQLALFERWGFRPPAVLEKLMKFDL